jgi:formamidase
MNGLGGLNKSNDGIVIGLVQQQLPFIVTASELRAQTVKVSKLVAKARRNLATMDLVVFPEYSLHGLSMDTNPEIMCKLNGPEVAILQTA